MFKFQTALLQYLTGNTSMLIYKGEKYAVPEKHRRTFKIISVIYSMIPAFSLLLYFPLDQYFHFNIITLLIAFFVLVTGFLMIFEFIAKTICLNLLRK